MKKGLRLSALWLALAMLTTLFVGCAAPSETQEDIIILFTNDVHCATDDYLGYASLAAYRAYCETVTPHTVLVDCGDAIQGGTIGTVSKGEYIVDLMNLLDYDFAILGNHEFDFGMEQLGALAEKAEATYLGCNVTYSGMGENGVDFLKPYEIVTYGTVSVAFIGVSTPHTLSGSTPTYFMEDGEFVYSFNGGSAEAFYSTVQGYIDECTAAGAEYVVLLTHLGDLAEESPYTSVELIENTEGADAVLDGHSHSEIPCRPVKDASGNTVLLSSTGTKLENIGQLTISANGTVSTGLVSGFDWKDEEADALVKEIREGLSEQLDRVIGRADVRLSISDESGVRLVRTRETAIGNFCADAYRAVTGADVALVNGGGIRADIDVGDITYADLIAVHPFGNTLCMIELTGQELLDVLEISYSVVQSEHVKDGKPCGENGEFMQVSGMRLTVDTSVESTVEYDEYGMVSTIGEARRLRDVMILNADGEYEPIDPDRLYTLASHNYYLKNNGGNHTFFDDNRLLIDESIYDYEVLITYITAFADGVIGETYASTEGRIVIAED